MNDRLDPQDIAALRMLAGASFGPGATVTLPSGRTIGPDEAQALTSAYAPAFQGHVEILGPIAIDPEDDRT